ncbi:REP-associated tyrosine transposase [Thalassolituus oleivorans]|jgi:REP element-mobilizing transposase RayT|uniref:REP-associated tyrosine transposase n=1 Tax=Thalassolituus oleivorans TaxID=187493 RepID=UPI0023F1282B|nr:transposase [Thalassolituus oleivorans]
MLKGHSNLRKGRFSEPGRIYLVTATTNDRTPIFSDPKYAIPTCRFFTKPTSLLGNSLLSWVLMPDHIHWLIELGENGDLSKTIQLLKSGSARIIRERGYGNKVWAPAFHDRAIRKDEDLKQAARYIVANPLRAGLVKRLGDYPYWDAVWL